MLFFPNYHVSDRKNISTICCSETAKKEFSWRWSWSSLTTMLPVTTHRCVLKLSASARVEPTGKHRSPAPSSACQALDVQHAVRVEPGLIQTMFELDSNRGLDRLEESTSIEIIMLLWSQAVSSSSSSSSSTSAT